MGHFCNIAYFTHRSTLRPRLLAHLDAKRHDFAPWISKSVPQRRNRLQKNSGCDRKDVPQVTSVRFVCSRRAVSAVLSMVSDDSGVSTI